MSFHMFDENELCDKCLAKVEADPETTVSEYCARCRAKLHAWAELMLKETSDGQDDQDEESKDERDAWRTVFRAYRTSCPLKRWVALDQLISIRERDRRH
jgi:hypothetical protein